MNLLLAICPHCDSEDDHEVMRASDNGKQIELMCHYCGGVWLEDNDTPMPGICKDCDE